MSDDYRYPHSLVSLPVLNNAHVGSAGLNASAVASNVPESTEKLLNTDPTRFVEQKLIEGKVIEALRQVYDPEIPIDIYELGLIYDIQVEPDRSVKIKMTLTAPACPVAGSLPGEVERKVEEIPEVKSADVELVWDPPWSRDRMSEAALLQLGLL
jgi:FeS assembly SUF system protein